MTHELESTRAVRAWLEDGVTRLPDRVLDAVLADLPQTAQRQRSIWTDARSLQRSTWVRLLVALMALAIIGSSLAIASGAWRLAPVPRAFDTVPLEAGRYVIDDPFPVRISLDVPDGWVGQEITSDTVQFVHPVDAALSPALTFTLVDAIYPDPCHFDERSIHVVGPTVDDLASALAQMSGVYVTGPTPASLGGYEGRAMMLTAPQAFLGCSNAVPSFRVWGLPQTHSLEPGERNPLWLVQVGSTRLVVSTDLFTHTTPEIEAQLDAMVGSIRLGEYAASVVPTPPPPPTPLPLPEPTIAPLPAGWSIENIPYVTYLTVYDYDANGRAVPVDVLDSVFEGQTGWIASSRGIASGQDAPPPATLSWWNVGTAYRDPCHWQSTAFDGTTAPLLQSNRGLSEILTDWLDVPGTPEVTKEPIAIAWLGLVYQLELAVPGDVDISTCDAEQYRLWAEHDGTPRLGYPGEHITLETIDFDPGLLVVDTSWRRDASVVERGQAQAARDSLWIGRTHDPTASP